MSITTNEPLRIYLRFMRLVGSPPGSSFSSPSASPVLRELKSLTDLPEFDRPPVVEVQFSQMPPLRRMWFLNESGRELIQIQEDQFVRNWRNIARGNLTSGDMDAVLLGLDSGHEWTGRGFP